MKSITRIMMMVLVMGGEITSCIEDPTEDLVIKDAVATDGAEDPINPPPPPLNVKN